MFKALKITFHLDGTGVYYDPYEPPTLDGILAACCCRHHVHGDPPARDEEPFDIPLPLKRWTINDYWGWHASVLFCEEEAGESLQYWRKRFRQSRVELSTGAPNLTNGIYRDWNMPLPLTLTRYMTAHAFGERREVKRELKRSVRYVGKKRAHGRGAVTGVDVEEIPDDLSLTRDGVAVRWLPREDGSRLVRPRPPYWNAIGRIRCAEIGEQFRLKHGSSK